MFWWESEGALGPVAAESRSKADVLRGIVTDRLSTAAREILAVVERTVAEYEEEAAGFRQEIDRQRQALGVLLESQVKTEPTTVCPVSASTVEPQLCPVTAVKEEEEEAGGAENPEQDGHVWNDQQLCPVNEHIPGATLLNEEAKEEAGGKENPGQDQPVWSEQLFNRVYAESQHLLVKPPGKIVEEGDGGGESPEEDDHMSYGEFENLGLISYIEEDDEDGEELPPFRGSPKQRNKRPRPLPRSGTRTSLRLRMSDPKELIQLSVCVLPGPHITEISPSELTAYPTKEVSCPAGLQQEDFLDLLRVTFPQISNKPFDLFWTDDSGKLLPLHVETLTAEEIQRNLENTDQSVYIRLQAEVESNITAISSCPETPNTTKLRFVVPSRTRKGTENEQGFIDLEILVPGNYDMDGPSLQGKSSKWVKVVRCPLGLQEEDFLSQLKSLFPQLAGDSVIELFHTNPGSNPVPVKATKLTPEEIWKSISAGGPGTKLCVQKKATRPAADVKVEDVSSPAHQDETQVDQTSYPEDPEPQMTEKCPEFSDEQFDSSCTEVSDSAEEYVPEATSESEDSDVDPSPRSKQTLCVLNNPGSVSPPVDDSPALEHDNNSIESDVTGAEAPCSSQDAMGIVVVGASQKEDGSRVYNKRHYCLYCTKPYIKMARHLQSAHKDKSEVAQALSFPTSSVERRKQLDYIRKKGNYAHNAAVMESGQGELVPCKRPSKEGKGNDFVHCVYCQGLFTRPFLWKHMRNCKFKPASVTLKLEKGKHRVQSMCTYMGPVPSHVSKQLWGVISVMIPDPITHIIKSDHVITDLGQHLLDEGGMSVKNQQYVRVKMRELGRLIHNGKKVTALKTMEDVMHPKNYLEMVKAVKKTCRFDSETNKFAIPSLAYKIGNALVKVSKLLKTQGLISDNNELVRNATEFQKIHTAKWNELVSATALRNIAETKWNVPALMLFTEDVQKMHQFLSQMQDECTSALCECPSPKAWADLTKVCLTQTILFNRRRERKVASMPLSGFLSRDTTNLYEDVDWALSEVEKKMYSHFSRVIFKGRQGRSVPILLTDKMLSALELLVKQRKACGVLKDNLYMFAQPGTMSHFRGSNCMHDFAEACGAKCPKSLTSTKLRNHAAALSTVLNMTDTQMDQLADFLGHDVKIHREFYQLPEKTLYLSKISKVLMALEEGRLAEFQGKNLDEITIGPNECVLETDEEDVNREEGNLSLLDDEPSADVPPQEEAVSSGVSAVSPSTKGKIRRNRRPWLQLEVKAAEKHMMRFIMSGTVPGKRACVKCLRAEAEALKNRDWKCLKFYVANRIAAKRKRKTPLK